MTTTTPARAAANHTIAFLRMTAIQLRRIAEREPRAGDQLRYTAERLDAEADDLAAQFGRGALPAAD